MPKQQEWGNKKENLKIVYESVSQEDHKNSVVLTGLNFVFLKVGILPADFYY